MKLNPLSPDSYFWIAAGACFFQGQHDRASDYLHRMDDPTPAARLAAANAAMAGDMRTAKAMTRKVKETYPDFDVETWLSVVPFREQWQQDFYREGLIRAGFR
jgi:hypothetical protein